MKIIASIGKERLNNILKNIPIPEKVIGFNKLILDFNKCPSTCKNRAYRDISVCEQMNCSRLVLSPSTYSKNEAKNILNDIEPNLNLDIKEKLIEIKDKSEYFKTKSDTFKLSKYQLLQFLLYHFLVKQKDGIIHNIKEKEIANILNCTVKTVRNNNYILKELNLITFFRVDIGIIDVEIRGYSDYFLSKEEGGKGFIRISKNFFNGLLNMSHENVNSLRLALYELIEYDNLRASKRYEMNFKDTDVYSFTRTIKNIKNLLPKRFFKKKILSLIEIINKNKIFTISKEDRILTFKLNKDMNGYIQFIELDKSYKNLISNRLDKFKSLFKIKFTEKDLKDLIDLSFLYSIKAVNNCLDLFSSSENAKDDVRSGNIEIGAYVRTLIKNLN